MRSSLRMLAMVLGGCLLAAGCASTGDGNGLDDEEGGGGSVSRDRDRDHIADSRDNCPDVPNPDQADEDGDDIGDACDEGDADGDGVPNADDNCPSMENPEQEDTDEDGIGDLCEDLDVDSDGVIDEDDNCPLEANPDQADADDDGIGDLCDDTPGGGGGGGGGANGSITYGWEIYQFGSYADCFAANVDTISITATSGGNSVTDTFYCSDIFGVSSALPSGSYSISATVYDYNGIPMDTQSASAVIDCPTAGASGCDTGANFYFEVGF